MKQYEILTPIEKELEKLFQIEITSPWLDINMDESDLAAAYMWCNKRHLTIIPINSSNGKTYYRILIP